MIVPMKKATIIVLDSRREEEVENLKRLGLLHPMVERRSDDRIEQLEHEHEIITRALGELPPDVESDDETPVADAMHLAHHVVNLAEHRRGRMEVLQRIDSEIMRVSRWGEFDPESIAELAEHGVDVRLYAMSPKDYRKNAPEGSILLEKDGASARFALVWFNGEHPSGMSPEEVRQIPGMLGFKLPDVPLSRLRERRDEERAEIERVQTELAEIAGRRAALETALDAVTLAIRDNHVRLGMDSEEQLAHITGFIPADESDSLKQAAANNGWGTLIRDPDPEDEVPTKTKNPAIVRIIKPVFDLLGVVPGYRERDISFFFLLFFIVFVGMIIGDAGYGAILLVLSLLGLARSRGKSKLGAVLLMVLSLSTLAWGAMSGNWFGYEPLGEIAPLSYLRVPALDAFDPASTQAVQAVCFILAAVHLSIAHLWNFFRELREKPASKAFAQLGWLSTLLGLYLLVVSLFLGSAFPGFGLYMIAGGVAAVFLFSGQSQEKGFIGGVIDGLKNAFTNVFDVIGAFSDIISYIRLFAVGLASVAIAQAFNEMATSIGFEGPAIVGAIVVLGLGHTLNLVMGGLAVIVHGVRLNLLEFSGHLGMEWTGTEYQPFSESNRTAS